MSFATAATSACIPIKSEAALKPSLDSLLFFNMFKELSIFATIPSKSLPSLLNPSLATVLVLESSSKALTNASGFFSPEYLLDKVSSTFLDISASALFFLFLY